jgi:hypothetical protein
VEQPMAGERLSSFCSDLPIFVIHCTGPATRPLLSTKEGDRRSFFAHRRGTLCNNNYLE